MSKSKITPYELYEKIIYEVGDPGGLSIAVLRADDGQWFAEVRSGRTPLAGSGFQNAVDEVVARLRLQYDLCVYSICPPMVPEGGRRHGRVQSSRSLQHWIDKGVTEVAPLFDINNDFFKTGH